MAECIEEFGYLYWNLDWEFFVENFYLIVDPEIRSEVHT